MIFSTSWHNFVLIEIWFFLFGTDFIQIKFGRDLRKYWSIPAPELLLAYWLSQPSCLSFPFIRPFQCRLWRIIKLIGGSCSCCCWNIKIFVKDNDLVHEGDVLMSSHLCQSLNKITLWLNRILKNLQFLKRVGNFDPPPVSETPDVIEEQIDLIHKNHTFGRPN